MATSREENNGDFGIIVPRLLAHWPSQFRALQQILQSYVNILFIMPLGRHSVMSLAFFSRNHKPVMITVMMGRHCLVQAFAHL